MNDKNNPHLSRSPKLTRAGVGFAVLYAAVIVAVGGQLATGAEVTYILAILFALILATLLLWPTIGSRSVDKAVDETQRPEWMMPTKIIGSADSAVTDFDQLATRPVEGGWSTPTRRISANGLTDSAYYDGAWIDKMAEESNSETGWEMSQEDYDRSPKLPEHSHRPAPPIVPAQYWLARVWPPGAAQALTAPVVRIGSDPNCEVVVAGPEIRPEHCVLLWTGQGWTVQATFEGGVKVGNRVLTESDGPIELQPGILIEMHDCLLRLIAHTSRLEGRHLVFDAASATSTGSRASNQDRAAHQKAILVLADGVQGRPGGSDAATVAVQAVKRAAGSNPDAELRSWLAQVTQELGDAEAENPLLGGMATTLDIARLTSLAPNRWIVEGLHVGDSNVFVLDGDEWLQMTVPHTVREEIRLSGQVPPDSMIGIDSVTLLMRPHRSVVGQQWAFEAAPDQRWILCSDGVLNALSNAGLEEAVKASRSESPRSTARAIVEQSLVGELEKDNLTVIVADIQPVA